MRLDNFALNWYDTYIFFADQNTTAFKEVAIIRHPRVGEYAFGFITSTVTLQVLVVYVVYSSPASIVELCSRVTFENLQFLPYILVKLCIACARISCYVIKFIIKFYIVLTLDNYISSSLITDHACKLIPAER